MRLTYAGNLVAAVYKEVDPKRHGHTAGIRPTGKNRVLIENKTPQVMQVGKCAGKIASVPSLVRFQAVQIAEIGEEVSHDHRT